MHRTTTVDIDLNDVAFSDDDDEDDEDNHDVTHIPSPIATVVVVAPESFESPPPPPPSPPTIQKLLSFSPSPPSANAQTPHCDTNLTTNDIQFHHHSPLATSNESSNSNSSNAMNELIENHNNNNNNNHKTTTSITRNHTQQHFTTLQSTSGNALKRKRPTEFESSREQTINNNNNNNDSSSSTPRPKKQVRWSPNLDQIRWIESLEAHSDKNNNNNNHNISPPPINTTTATHMHNNNRTDMHPNALHRKSQGLTVQIQSHSATILSHNNSNNSSHHHHHHHQNGSPIMSTTSPTNGTPSPNTTPTSSNSSNSSVLGSGQVIGPRIFVEKRVIHDMESQIQQLKDKVQGLNQMITEQDKTIKFLESLKCPDYKLHLNQTNHNNSNSYSSNSSSSASHSPPSSSIASRSNSNNTINYLFSAPAKEGKVVAYDLWYKDQKYRKANLDANGVQYDIPSSIDCNRYNSSNRLMDDRCLGMTQWDNEHMLISFLQNNQLIKWNVMKEKPVLIEPRLSSKSVTNSVSASARSFRAGKIFRFRDKLVNIVNSSRRPCWLQLINVDLGQVVLDVEPCSKWINSACVGGQYDTGVHNSYMASNANRDMYLFSCSQDLSVHRYHMDQGTNDWTVKVEHDPRSIIWSYTHQLLFCGLKSGVINCYDTRQSKIAFSIDTKSHSCGSLLEHKGMLVSGAWSQVAIWDVRQSSSSALSKFETPERVQSIVPVFNNQEICVSSGHEAYIYSVSSGRATRKQFVYGETPFYTVGIFEANR